MGRSTTPTFRVEMSESGLTTGKRYRWQGAWNSKYSGRPSDKNLAAYVAAHEASTRSGGVNECLGPMKVNSAQVVRQSSGEVVATFTAPAFEVIA